MSILDIIEALREFAYDNRPRHWKVLQVKCSVAIQQLDELAKEVALMEAVCDAAKRKDDGRFGGRSLHYCIADLTAFRKERGL